MAGAVTNRSPRAPGRRPRRLSARSTDAPRTNVFGQAHTATCLSRGSCLPYPPESPPVPSWGTLLLGNLACISMGPTSPLPIHPRSGKAPSPFRIWNSVSNAQMNIARLNAGSLQHRHTLVVYNTVQYKQWVHTWSICKSNLQVLQRKLQRRPGPDTNPLNTQQHTDRTHSATRARGSLQPGFNQVIPLHQRAPWCDVSLT